MNIAGRVMRYLGRQISGRLLPSQIVWSENRFAAIKRRIATDSPVIVDGGAHTGDVVDTFLWNYRSPTIHAFEPIPELAQRLRQKYAGRPNVIVHAVALGATSASVTLNVTGALESSSILEPTALHADWHGSGQQVQSRLQVSQRRLDDVLDSGIDILKLDLQGAELAALEGAGELLQRTRLVLTEVEFVALYRDQPLFADIDRHLRAKGFRLLNLYEWFCHASGQLSSADAIYLNERYFP